MSLDIEFWWLLLLLEVDAGAGKVTQQGREPAT